MCWLGLAWKPWIWLGFVWLRLKISEAGARASTSGQAWLGSGLSHGFTRDARGCPNLNFFLFLTTSGILEVFFAEGKFPMWKGWVTSLRYCVENDFGMHRIVVKVNRMY
ncbi:hypothetical protein B0H11DRAFT_1938653 [Mycena galericulata]|nr:hypothetical protein B0H11DRAFT_1938653 [Mycena galericulata]